MKSHYECPACGLWLEWFNGKLWCGSTNCRNIVCANGSAGETPQEAFEALQKIVARKVETKDL